MKKIVFLVLIILVVLVLFAFTIDPYHQIKIKGLKELPKVDGDELLTKALYSITEDEGVNQGFSYTNMRLLFNISICKYKGEIGGVIEDGFDRIYYVDNKFQGLPEYIEEPNIDEILSRVELIYTRMVETIESKKAYRFTNTAIGNENFYEIQFFNNNYLLGEEQTRFVVSVYFNEEKDFVGATAMVNMLETVSISTFNINDGTFIKEDFKDVWEWINYPPDLK